MYDRRDEKTFIYSRALRLARRGLISFLSDENDQESIFRQDRKNVSQPMVIDILS